jgi:GT2 family glycosyltransferase
MPPQVSIIILCHNDKRYLRNCADSIARHTQPGTYECIIIDNGSPDDAIREISAIKRRAPFPVKVIRNKNNRFFGPANNQGLAAAKGRFVLFLNADTIVTQGWLRTMLAAFSSNPKLGMAGPMTNSAVGLQLVSDPCEGREEIPGWFSAWKSRRSTAVRIVPWIIGFCALMPRKLAVRLGGFDELYGPGGFEDYDLCLRTRLAGHEIGIASGAYVHHFGGKGYVGMDYDAMRKSNREIYLAKWCRLLRQRIRLEYETPVRA